MNRLALAFTLVTFPIFAAEPPASPPAEAAKKDEAPATAEKPPAVAADPTDLGGFGSDEAIERTDLPTRGIITFPPPADGYANMDHWHQYDWKFKARRWGHYQVRLTYRLDHATLGVQFKHGETRLKKILQAAPSSHRTYLGEIFFPEAGDQAFAIYAPPADVAAGFEIKELALVPTFEGEPTVKPAADGSITLLAKDATTWSENMRYEPKAEKNCLGYWTDPADFAEWEFEAPKPGKYRVLITHGCGKGNGGSQVAVHVGGQEAKFTVEETGGFQNWKEALVGEIEIKAAGTQRLTVDPLKKAKTAVMDVQKIQLKPVS